MPLNYRRPGVYLEESLLSSAGDVSNATSVAMFVGAAPKGPINDPVRIETWGDYTSLFGGFTTVTDPVGEVQALSYLPYSVYSYFQNGGRTAYVVRSIPTSAPGDVASKVVTGVKFSDNVTAEPMVFKISARSAGTWGTNLSYTLRINTPDGTIGSSPITDVIFAIQVILTTNGVSEVVESFPNLSIAGTVSGTRMVTDAINDLVTGSRYIQISDARTDSVPAQALVGVPLAGGTDPNLPTSGDLTSSAVNAAPRVEGPILLNIVGYVSDVNAVETATWADSFVGASVASSSWSDRQDIFIVNDNCPPRESGQSATDYKTSMLANTALGANTSDSYSASYGPWVLVGNPLRAGSVLSVPAGGAVMGMMARIDATIGVFRAPAGVIASLNNVIGVQTKFTDTELGDLNSANVNIIRPVTGAGIAVMGARTRKSYGADRYVSARRTLIFIREVLRRSTQFAVFENNDSRLWSSLRMSAERILRPLWEAGGLRGANAPEAYFIRCDDTVNTPSVIAAGEVRMEIGVALEYPAEFVIIRVSQFDRGQITTEVNASI